MSSLTPRLASLLALEAYSIQSFPKNMKLRLDPIIEKEFIFNSQNVIQGTSGGFFWRPKTGFVLIGKGKSQQYKDDHVIAIRGTNPKYTPTY